MQSKWMITSDGPGKSYPAKDGTIITPREITLVEVAENALRLVPVYRMSADDEKAYPASLMGKNAVIQVNGISQPYKGAPIKFEGAIVNVEGVKAASAANGATATAAGVAK